MTAAAVVLLANVVLTLRLVGQAPPADVVLLTIDDDARVLTGRLLDSLAADTVSAQYHDRPTVTYVGVALDRLLGYAGVPVPATGLRGRQFERVIVIEAHDGYRMVFGLGELDPSVTGRHVVLTRTNAQDEGPWRLVVPGDRGGARWVRQVRAIRVSSVPRQE